LAWADHSHRHLRRAADAVLRCCTDMKKAGFTDRNRPLTWGGAKGIRTPDLLHAMQTRYQLRHSPSYATLEKSLLKEARPAPQGHSLAPHQSDLVSHPDEVAQLIKTAAEAVQAAS
jgi:hypothetical protein